MGRCPVRVVSNNSDERTHGAVRCGAVRGGAVLLTGRCRSAASEYSLIAYVCANACVLLNARVLKGYSPLRTAPCASRVREIPPCIAGTLQQSCCTEGGSGELWLTDCCQWDPCSYAVNSFGSVGCGGPPTPT